VIEENGVDFLVPPREGVLFYPHADMVYERVEVSRNGQIAVFADEWHPVREDVWRVWPLDLWVVVDHQAQPVGARALRSNHEKPGNKSNLARMMTS